MVLAWTRLSSCTPRHRVGSLLVFAHLGGLGELVIARRYMDLPLLVCLRIALGETWNLSARNRPQCSRTMSSLGAGAVAGLGTAAAHDFGGQDSSSLVTQVSQCDRVHATVPFVLRLIPRSSGHSEFTRDNVETC